MISAQTKIGSEGKRAFWLKQELRRCTTVVDILIVFLILMLVGSLPSWPYSRRWGFYGTGGIGAILILVVILMLLDVF